MKKSDVVLAVNGGVVSDVQIPRGIRVIIRDYDVEGCDAVLDKDEDGAEYREITFQG